MSPFESSQSKSFCSFSEQVSLHKSLQNVKNTGIYSVLVLQGGNKQLLLPQLDSKVPLSLSFYTFGLEIKALECYKFTKMFELKVSSLFHV